MRQKSEIISALPLNYNLKPKKQKKYLVSEDDLDFNTVSKKMTEMGYEMNQSTARNIFMSSFEIFIKEFINQLRHSNIEKNISIDKISNIMKNHSAYSSMPEILYKANQLLMNEQKKDIK